MRVHGGGGRSRERAYEGRRVALFGDLLRAHEVGREGETCNGSLGAALVRMAVRAFVLRTKDSGASCQMRGGKEDSPRYDGVHVHRLRGDEESVRLCAQGRRARAPRTQWRSACASRIVEGRTRAYHAQWGWICMRLMVKRESWRLECAAHGRNVRGGSWTRHPRAIMCAPSCA